MYSLSLICILSLFSIIFYLLITYIIILIFQDLSRIYNKNFRYLILFYLYLVWLRRVLICFAWVTLLKYTHQRYRNHKWSDNYIHRWQFFEAVTMHNIFLAIAIGLFVYSHICYGFFMNYFGQDIIDHSEYLFQQMWVYLNK